MYANNGMIKLMEIFEFNFLSAIPRIPLTCLPLSSMSAFCNWLGKLHAANKPNSHVRLA